MKKQYLGINVDTPKKHKIYGIKVIRVPLYRCSVELLFGKQTKELEEKWGQKVDYDGHTRNYLDVTRRVTICFKDNNPIISTVVHELCHATQMILKGAGHNYYKQAGDEPFAYLLTYLVDEYQKFKKFK